MSDLRARIADALAAHTYAGMAVSGSDCAGGCDCPERCACGAVSGRWDAHAAAAVESVVNAELERRNLALSHALGVRGLDPRDDRSFATLIRRSVAMRRSRELADRRGEIREAREAALGRVRRLHPTREVPAIHSEIPTAARSAYVECATCLQPYPCPTLRAIDTEEDL